jgi:glycosyltransferase involved in cell wall biosynthesis
MIRVLHLLEQYPDYQTESGATKLRNDRSGSFDVTTRTIGLHGDWTNTAMAILWMRRHREPIDLVHAWGERALSVAALGTASPIVYSPTRFPSRRATRWLRAVMSVRDVNVVCPTDTMRRAFVERGVPIGRCHLIRPGVDFSKIKRRRNPALRRALGFADDDYVMLAAGESTRAAAHDQAVWAGSILHVLDPHYRLLLWGRGEMARRTQRFAEKTEQQTLLSVATKRLGRDVAFQELFAGADMVLATARGPVDTLAIAASMASGLPIVATVSTTVAELLEDRHTALMVGKAAPRAVAQRVLDLRADPSLQWSIADMARTEAYEFFSLTRFLSQWRGVYQQIAAGDAVQVAHQAPGAGLRFHGRG